MGLGFWLKPAPPKSFLGQGNWDFAVASTVVAKFRNLAFAWKESRVTGQYVSADR